MRRRSRQEPLHASGRCLCQRSGIPALPWATVRNRGTVARPAHNAPIHFGRCPHSDLRRSTSVSIHAIRAALQPRRRRVPRYVLEAV